MLVFDEMDKLCVDDSASKYGRTILGQILTLISGDSYTVGDMDDETIKHHTDKDRKFSRGSTLRTGRILTIICGAWSDQRLDAEEAAGRSLGFDVGSSVADRDGDVGDLALADLAGIPVELRGRIARHASLRKLTPETLMGILNATAQRLLPDDHRRLTQAAREAIVARAITDGTGARGLTAAVTSLRDHLLWSDDVGPTVPITDETITAAVRGNG
jgi:ATP-dependent protease Clp ATPase subunit